MPAHSPPDDILHFYAQTNTAYLHASGAFATAQLAALLDGQPGEKILEIGFGTGATAAYMALAFPKTAFFGVDISPVMYRKAKARLRFCGLARRCQLFQVEKGAALPFREGYFDKIFVESVLGVQEGESLVAAITEIQRLLKPGGKLVLNETIWLDGTTPEEMKQFNRQCLEKFGIIQANENYPYLSDWVALLEKKHIRVEKIRHLNEMEKFGGLKPVGLSLLLSETFTLWGRLKTKLHPRYRNMQTRYDMEGSNIRGEKNYMEGILMLASKMP